MNRPIEEGTKILNEALVLFNETPALMELWSWEGENAASLIFLNKSQDQMVEFLKIILNQFQYLSLALPLFYEGKL